MDSHPKLKGKVLSGIRQVVTEPYIYGPVETGVHVLHAFYHHSQRQQNKGFIDRANWLTRLAGTNRLHLSLKNGATPRAIIADWQEEVDKFILARTPYLLY